MTERLNGGAWWPRVWLAALLCLWGVVGSARAQTGQSAAGAGPGAAGASDEVSIEKERFGVGDVYRPGDMVGVRLRVMDHGLKPRNIVVQMPGFDPDGDQALVRREIASNPGSWQGVWLYFRMPLNATSFEVRAYEALEGGTAEQPQFRTGRLLGTQFISPSGSAVGMTGEPQDQIAVIGQKSYALNGYSVRVGSAPQGHEIVNIVNGVAVEDAPDRWMGWAPFSVVVWGNGDPSKLDRERSRALREWISRGGHLVVILPRYGETWTNPSSNDLSDLLPAVKLSRREGVDLTAYAPLLTKRKNPVLPKEEVIHEMTPMDGAAVGDAIRIFNGPDGKCIAARRLVGLGAVDLVGIDLNAPAFADREMLDVDVFWNRILGRRGEYRSSQELNQLDRENNGLNKSDSSRADYEIDIPRLIAKTGKAGAALALGVVVFIIYWLVAGPGGFAVLKFKGAQRHAWLAYALAAAAFTLVAWGGATTLRPARVEADHLTFMDHVFGQPVERTRTWASLLIPWYGEATISVGTEDDPASPGRSLFTNTVAAWAPRDTESSGRGSFPDARGYDIDVKSPGTMTVPTRSTVKQLLIDWAGTPPWKMPVPGTEGIRRGPESRLEGVLTHGLPGPLKDVYIIDIPGQSRLASRPGAPLTGRAYKLTTDWNPGEELVLATVTEKASSIDNQADKFLENLAESAKRIKDLLPTERKDQQDAPQRLTALSLYTQLAPPNLTNLRDDPLRVKRAETHGWDLGRWFSQPCVIIIGQLVDTESPTPLLVNGQPVKSRGRTVVRWVYPMPDSPPEYPEIEPLPIPGSDGSPTPQPPQ